MPKKSEGIKLTSYDDLFSTEESREEQARETVQQIPVDQLVPFRDHPFKVKDDEDMENLAGLTNLEHLNIGDMPKLTGLAFTDNMTKLKRFHCTMNNIPQEEIDRFIALHPDCEVNFSKSTDPIEGGWRYNLGGQGIHDARYLLLREQIGYLGADISRWPQGELKEEITYESTGIIPE